MNAVNGCGVWIASDSGKGETSDLQPPAPLYHGETRRGGMCEYRTPRTCFYLDPSRHPGGRFERSDPSGFFTGKTGCVGSDPVTLTQNPDFRFFAFPLLPSPVLSGT